MRPEVKAEVGCRGLGLLSRMRPNWRRRLGVGAEDGCRG